MPKEPSLLSRWQAEKKVRQDPKLGTGGGGQTGVGRAIPNSDTPQPIGSVTIKAEVRTTIDCAVELFIQDKRTECQGDSVIGKYTRELNRYTAFMGRRNRLFPADVIREDLSEYRAGWAAAYPSSQTRIKVQERLRAFLRFCYDASYIERIPRLSAIKDMEKRVVPLTDEEYEQLLATVSSVHAGPKATRVHALIQVMRYSGLAITDTVGLERRELVWDKTVHPLTAQLCTQLAARLAAAYCCRTKSIRRSSSQTDRITFSPFAGCAETLLLSR